MTQNQTHKAFPCTPPHVLDLSNESLDGAAVTPGLAPEIRDTSSYATYIARNDEALGSELARVTAAQPAPAERQAGAAMPDFLATSKPGRPRKKNPLKYNTVTSYPPPPRTR